MTTSITFTPGEVSRYYAARGPELKQSRAAEWRGPCEVHHGTGPNFAVNAETGQAYCHSQCARGWDILSLEQELTGADFKTAKAEVFRLIGRDDSNSDRSTRRIAATYDYVDEAGQLLYQIVRYDPKDFKQRYPDGAGGWIWKKHPRQVLYHLPAVLKNQIIFICEGEKDCETLRDHGFIATCEAGGANAKWLDSYTQALAQPVRIEGEEFLKEAIILPDSDKPGRQRALRIAKALKGKVFVRIASMEDEPGIKDISDWFAAGHSEVELMYLLEKGLTRESR